MTFSSKGITDLMIQVYNQQDDFCSEYNTGILLGRFSTYLVTILIAIVNILA
jgi:hypothetical protein